MSMRVQVTINGGTIGRVDITNLSGLSDPKSTNVYRWHYSGDGHRVLDGELTHRYGDGAMVLASKVLAEIAKRYEVADTYMGGES